MQALDQTNKHAHENIHENLQKYTIVLIFRKQQKASANKYTSFFILFHLVSFEKKLLVRTL